MPCSSIPADSPAFCRTSSRTAWATTSAPGSSRARTNQAITPDQAQQGLGSGVIDSIAQRTGLSPTMVKGAAAVIIPMMVAHFAENGGVNQHPSALGGLASGFLSKLV